MAKEQKRYADRGFWGKLGYRAAHGNPWEQGEQPLTQAEQLQRSPIRYSLVKAVEIGQGVNPLKRLATSGKDRRHLTAEVIDGVRVLFAAYEARHLIEAMLPEGIGNALKDTLISNLELRGKRIPTYLGAGVAAGAAVTILQALHRMESERESTSLKDAPQEAKVIGRIYREQEALMVTATVNGEQQQISGAQQFAREYATKTLQDLVAMHGKRRVQEAQQSAQKLVKTAFAQSAENSDLQQSILLASGDAFERLLVEKEFEETAADISKRPQDTLINGAKNLGRRVSHALAKAKRIPLVGFAVPKELEKLFSNLAGEQPVQAGGISLDPQSFINAGSAKARKAVREELETQFKGIVTDELSHDATSVDIARINMALAVGPKLSDTEKAGFMNQVLAATLVQMRPDLAPKVAEVCGVLDATQNNPDKLGPEVANLPSRRRSRHSTRN